MICVKDYKKVSLDFRRIASNMLRTEYSNPDIPLQRFKNYIDTNEIVKEIIQNAIKNVEYDYTKCFVTDRGSGWGDLNIPVNENEHLRAMYDYMAYIVDNNIGIINISHNYFCSSRKITDTIQNFISLAFKPMVDYIVDELSKMILMDDEIQMKKIEVNANNSVVSIADNESCINSNNAINISQNDIKAISSLITSLKSKIDEVEISKDEKENFIDDLDVLQEQINSSEYKATRLKKSFNNIKLFLTNSALLVGTGITFAKNVKQLLELVQPLIDKII